MLNLVNKIITVILTLIVMINYSNGYITDKNVLSDLDKFTREEIKSCEQFKEEHSKYIINNMQYFLDKNGDYYILNYKIFGTTYDIYAPFKLYKLETKKYSGEFIECKDNIIHFIFNKNKLTFKLKDLQFLKPVDSFVQPPELRDADIIEKVDTCKEFNESVIQKNTTGFLIFVDKFANSFTRVCWLKGCTFNHYFYSESPKTASLSLDPSGFYWEEKVDSGNNIKWVYQNCDRDQLNFIKRENGKDDVNSYIKLPILKFYNINPKTRILEDVKSHLWKKLTTCEEFNDYLKDDKSILDGYIYFSDLVNPKNPIYYAMKVNLYGPADSRERANLLNYTQINSTYEGFAPVTRIKLFVGCESKLIKGDGLTYELDGDSRESYFIKLKNLLFYGGSQPYLDSASVIEMHTFRKKS